MRSSLANATVEGVERWPHVIQKTVEKLQDYYREKVGVPYRSKFPFLNVKIGQIAGTRI